MKKTLLFSLVLLIAAASAFSQNDRMIEYEKTFGGYNFTQNGQVLNIKSMSSIVSTVPEARSYMNKARFSNGASQVFSYIGGFCIGWPLGTAISGGDPEWGMMLVGAGFIAVALPFIRATNINSKEAADLYNEYYSSDVKGAVLKFGPTQHGIGLSLTF